MSNEMSNKMSDEVMAIKEEIEQLQNKINGLMSSVEKHEPTVTQLCTKKTFMEIGKKYFIRTVTMVYLAKVVSMLDDEILCVDASWVADTGRFHIFLKEGKFDEHTEIEPYPDFVAIKSATVVDYVEYKFNLPKEAV